MNRHRWFLLIFIFGLGSAFFASGLHRFLTLDTLKLQHATITDYNKAHPVAAVTVYAATYILVTGLSLPGATAMTLAGGAVFGLVWGTIIVSLASTIGATLALLAARFLFRDSIKARFGQRLKTIDDGMARDGWLYLFTLRLVPAFPFFMVNLAMGLTAMPVRTFFWVSQIGMLPGTLVYVNAGTQLAKIDSLSGILSPGLIFSFALLGVFPWLARKLVGMAKAGRVYVK